MLMLSTTLGRLLITARQNYQVYLRRTESTYKANPPARLESPLGKLVWCWSHYRKKGASGALSSKWSGPWRVITFKPPALTLLQSEWLHRKGKPETQRESVLNKLRLYLPSEPEEEDLEEDKLAMIDGDEDATDPLVDAQELLPRMKWLSCRIPPLQRRCRKAIKMVKSVGEGDWGGKGDLEKPEVRTHPSYMDWLLDFVGAGQPLVSGGLDNDNATRWEPLDTLGPSTRPMSASNLPAALRAREGEVPPQTPPEADISRVRDTAASVSARPPTEPDLQPNISVRSPEPPATAAVPRIQPATTSQQTQCRQLTSPRLWQRDVESEKEKPPSKVTKSVRWVKSLLGFSSASSKEKEEPMTEGDTPLQSTPTTTPGNSDNNPEVPIDVDSSSDSEEEMEQSPDTSKEMEQSLDTSEDME